MVKIVTLSPAKINLMLRIVGQNHDGYHNLQTCFQILEWGDQIEYNCVNLKGNNKITIKGFAGLKKADNLIFQAAESIRKYAQTTSDWLIDVKKHIPSGSGLGGGSSNAAETLKLLNKQWQCGLSISELMVIGKKLGADVPIFISERSALATGIGDRLETMDFDTPYVLLIFPKTSISTQSLFNHPELTRNQVKLSKEELSHRDLWINDFFPLVLSQNDVVKSVYEQLKRNLDVRLTGTGSTLFALYEDESEAKKALNWAGKLVNCILVRPKRNTL